MTATVEALIGAVFIDSGESLLAAKVAVQGLGLINKDVENSDEDGGVAVLSYKLGRCNIAVAA